MGMTDKQREEFGDRLQAAFRSSWDAAQQVIKEAYEAGLIAGKVQAEKQMGEKLAQVLGFSQLPPLPPDSQLPLPPPLPPPPPPLGVPGPRAPRGTVKPTVIEALRNRPGAKPADIAAATGVNENSVRGALNKLIEDGITEKRGDLWYLVAQK